jgi:hypothetical protein
VDLLFNELFYFLFYTELYLALSYELCSTFNLYYFVFVYWWITFPSEWCVIDYFVFCVEALWVGYVCFLDNYGFFLWSFVYFSYFYVRFNKWNIYLYFFNAMMLIFILRLNRFFLRCFLLHKMQWFYFRWIFKPIRLWSLRILTLNS